MLPDDAGPLLRAPVRQVRAARSRGGQSLAKPSPALAPTQSRRRCGRRARQRAPGERQPGGASGSAWSARLGAQGWREVPRGPRRRPPAAAAAARSAWRRWTSACSTRRSTSWCARPSRGCSMRTTLRATGPAAAAARDPAETPDLRGKISLRAAFAAAAATTAPARLGSEGASAAAELAEEDSRHALGPGPGHAQGPGAGAPAAAPAPDLRGRDSHSGAGQARSSAGVGTAAGAQAACCAREAGEDVADAHGAAPLAIHAAAGAAAAAMPSARNPVREGMGGAQGAGPAPGPGSGLGSPAHLLDAFPADPAAFPAASYANRALEAAALRASAGAYESLVAPGTGLALDVGNMYTGAARSVLLSSRAKSVVLMSGMGLAMGVGNITTGKTWGMLLNSRR